MAATTASPDADHETQEPPSNPANGTSRAETRPLTVMLPEDVLRKLKVIAVLKDRSVSELVADHIDALVREARPQEGDREARRLTPRPTAASLSS